ncbi:usg protein [Limobrevibacterium gyesilva]|uniref:Usg protein n=1 Tax=Limobrevibacterium gyesilva TaxID=2991712 RepID=A0AA41YNZ1_9PROT|nr:usg protein [Limobrevibacterium gyesilva]MCW3477039.1 usg protein [Limobrevibacterium gyesilva]
MQAHTQLQRQLQGYRLTTAEILYHLPDHPAVLQSYIWQELDMAPRYPVLHRFLDFWTREIDGRLHSVRVASVGIIGPAEWRHTQHLIQLH